MSEEFLTRLLDEIDSNYSDLFVFAGVLDNNSRMLDIRKGRYAKFDLPPDRRETLSVQISLLFALLPQLQDVLGDHKFTLAHFAKHDLLLLKVGDLHLFVIMWSSMSLTNQIVKLLETVGRQGPAAPHIQAQSEENNASQRWTEMINKVQQNVAKGKGDRSAGAPSAKPKPEPILMLQGFLKGLGGYTIEESGEIDSSRGAADHYKIKTIEADNEFAWTTLERIKSTFGDQINIHSIAKDADGRLAITISPKKTSLLVDGNYR